MFDKNDQELSQLIDSSLEAVLSGKATLEQVLADHPEHARLLRREIEAAVWLVSRRDQLAPRPGFINSSRSRVLGRIKQEASNTGAKHGIFGFLWPQNIAYQWVVGMLALIILFSGASGLVSYSQSAMPGEGLYPVKRASESIQYSLTIGELRRVEISADFTNRRLQEFVTLVQQGAVENLEPSLETYKEQVSQTVELLEESSDAQPHEKKVLASDLQEEFTQHASKLTAVKEQAPEEIQQDVEVAKNLTVLSASAAFQEGARIVDPTQTPTHVPSRTRTATDAPTRTPTPSPTATKTRPRPPLPTDTNVPSVPLPPTSTEAPTSTDVPTSTLAPTSTDVPTSTPAPTSTDVPTNTPVPNLPTIAPILPTETSQPTEQPISTTEPPEIKPPLPTQASTRARPPKRPSLPTSDTGILMESTPTPTE